MSSLFLNDNFFDGIGTSSKFTNIQNLVLDQTNDNIYVLDFSTIRKINISTKQTYTIAGNGFNGKCVNGVGTNTRFNLPRGIAIDDNNIYVADTNNHMIRKININDRTVTTLAGTGVKGFKDGFSNECLFNSPTGLCVVYNFLYICDSSNNAIRRLNLTTNYVTTIAGSRLGFLDGIGTNARFNNPTNIIYMPGNYNVDFFYVSDTGNQKIRTLMSTEFSPNGTYEYINYGVGTILGSVKGISNDETDTTSVKFNNPLGISFDLANSYTTNGLYICDSKNHLIKRFDNATGLVSTFAGNVRGYIDGTSPSFNNPCGVVFDIKNNNLFVADRTNGVIRQIELSNNNNTTTLAGNPSKSVNLNYIKNLFGNKYYVSIIEKTNKLPPINGHFFVNNNNVLNNFYIQENNNLLLPLTDTLTSSLQISNIPFFNESSDYIDYKTILQNSSNGFTISNNISYPSNIVGQKLYFNSTNFTDPFTGQNLDLRDDMFSTKPSFEANVQSIEYKSNYSNLVVNNITDTTSYKNILLNKDNSPNFELSSTSSNTKLIKQISGYSEFIYSSSDNNLGMTGINILSPDDNIILSNPALSTNYSYISSNNNCTIFSSPGDDYKITNENILTSNLKFIPTSMNSPNNGNVLNITDGNNLTKYINYDKSNVGFSVYSETPMRVGKISITICQDKPECDPSSWKLYGSNNKDATIKTKSGEVIYNGYELLGQGNITPNVNRLRTVDLMPEKNGYYKWYKLIFPNVANKKLADSIQVSEVKFYKAKSSAENLITGGYYDNNYSYVNFSKVNSQLIMIPTNNNNGILNNIALYLPFDYYTNTGGLPTYIKIYGSNDDNSHDFSSTSYTLIKETSINLNNNTITYVSVSDNKNYYKYFKIVFPTIANSNAPYMHLGRLELVFKKTNENYAIDNDLSTIYGLRNHASFIIAPKLQYTVVTGVKIYFNNTTNNSTSTTGNVDGTLDPTSINVYGALLDGDWEYIGPVNIPVSATRPREPYVYSFDNYTSKYSEYNKYKLVFYSSTTTIDTTYFTNIELLGYEKTDVCRLNDNNKLNKYVNYDKVNTGIVISPGMPQELVLSRIIGNIQLEKLIKLIPNFTERTLLYNFEKDEIKITNYYNNDYNQYKYYNNEVFKSKCRDTGANFFIFKTVSGKILGAYTEIPWKEVTSETTEGHYGFYADSSNSFIFNLTDPNNIIISFSKTPLSVFNDYSALKLGNGEINNFQFDFNSVTMDFSNPVNFYDNIIGEEKYTEIVTQTMSFKIPSISAFSKTTVVNCIGLIMASNKPECDPSSWKIYGSLVDTCLFSNTEDFTFIAEGTIPISSERSRTEFVTFDNNKPYKTYKIVFPNVADENKADSIQLSELNLYNVTNGSPSNVIDGDSSMKYINCDKNNSDIIFETISMNNNSNILITRSSIIKSISIIFGDDKPECDPNSWKLYGLDENDNSSLISESNIIPNNTRSRIETYSFLNNNTPYKKYMLLFPDVVNPSTAEYLQVAEIRLNGFYTDNLYNFDIKSHNTKLNKNTPYNYQNNNNYVMKYNNGFLNNGMLNEYFNVNNAYDSSWKQFDQFGICLNNIDNNILNNNKPSIIHIYTDPNTDLTQSNIGKIDLHYKDTKLISQDNLYYFKDIKPEKFIVYKNTLTDTSTLIYFVKNDFIINFIENYSNENSISYKLPIYSKNIINIKDLILVKNYLYALVQETNYYSVYKININNHTIEPYKTNFNIPKNTYQSKGSYLQFDLSADQNNIINGEVKVIKSYQIKHFIDTLNNWYYDTYDVKSISYLISWKIFGSNDLDNKYWQLLDTQINRNTYSETYTNKIYNINNTKSYKYIRIVINSQVGYPMFVAKEILPEELPGNYDIFFFPYKARIILKDSDGYIFKADSSSSKFFEGNVRKLIGLSSLGLDNDIILGGNERYMSYGNFTYQPQTYEGNVVTFYEDISVYNSNAYFNSLASNANDEIFISYVDDDITSNSIIYKINPDTKNLDKYVSFKDLTTNNNKNYIRNFCFNDYNTLFVCNSGKLLLVDFNPYNATPIFTQILDENPGSVGIGITDIRKGLDGSIYCISKYSNNIYRVFSVGGYENAGYRNQIICSTKRNNDSIIVSKPIAFDFNYYDELYVLDLTSKIKRIYGANNMSLTETYDAYISVTSIPTVLNNVDYNLYKYYGFDFPGYNKTIGPVGIKGEIGYTGPRGATGPKGVDGNQGQIGPLNLNYGREGDLGPIGPTGPDGFDNLTQGTTGEKGIEYNWTGVFDYNTKYKNNDMYSRNNSTYLVSFDNYYKTETLSGGSQGYKDSIGTNTKFDYPTGISFDKYKNIYVVDKGNNCIRKIDYTTKRSVTIAGNVLYYGGGYKDGEGTNALFKCPNGIVVDLDGENMYVSDTGNNCIRKISHTGKKYIVTTLAGNNLQYGDKDDIGTSALFNSPHGICLNFSTNDLYVADTLNNKIKMIDNYGSVITIAGNDLQGYSDGVGTASLFNNPSDLALDKFGNIYVADTLNNMIRKINQKQIVTTLAGTTKSGSLDGFGTNSSFSKPSCIFVDSNNNIYIGDSNNVLRKMIDRGLDGYEVTTFAGDSTMLDYVDSIDIEKVRFSYISDIVVDINNTIYIADSQNHAIRKMYDFEENLILPCGKGPQGLDGEMNIKEGNIPSVNGNGGEIIINNTDMYICDTTSKKWFKMSGLTKIINTQVIENLESPDFSDNNWTKQISFTTLETDLADPGLLTEFRNKMINTKHYYWRMYIYNLQTNTIEEDVEMDVNAFNTGYTSQGVYGGNSDADLLNLNTNPATVRNRTLWKSDMFRISLKGRDLDMYYNDNVNYNFNLLPNAGLVIYSKIDDNYGIGIGVGRPGTSRYCLNYYYRNGTGRSNEITGRRITFYTK